MSDRQDHDSAVAALEHLHEEASASESMFTQQRVALETILKIAKSQTVPRGKAELLITYDQRGSYFHGVTVICQECGKKFTTDQHPRQIQYCLGCGFEITNVKDEKSMDEMRNREANEWAGEIAARIGGVAQ